MIGELISIATEIASFVAYMTRRPLASCLAMSFPSLMREHRAMREIYEDMNPALDGAGGDAQMALARRVLQKKMRLSRRGGAPRMPMRYD